jgi:phosphoglycolate phosphatase-like HAD superfamily hydrolase
MRRLAVFDVDGTLTATNAVDDECFLRAVSHVLGVPIQSFSYANALHATDSYISRWLCEQHRGEAPSDAEVDRITERFVAELRAELERAPSRFAPIPGAVGLFEVLRERDWHVAVATGGWGPSARLKLAAAGIEGPDLIFACATDALTRTDIVRLAIERATTRSGPFDRVVSVGDRPWDVRTAAELSLPFVGVGSGDKAEAMRAAGATTVLDDLRARDAVLAALSAAMVPGA